MGFTGSGLTLQLEVTFASGSTVNTHKGKVIEIQTAIARCSERNEFSAGATGRASITGAPRSYFC